MRALDVLIALYNHDPSVLRNAAVADAADQGAGNAWGGPRTDARALVGRSLQLLGSADDEGVLVQAAEAGRILLDTSTMSPDEQNAFLDHLYASRSRFTCDLGEVDIVTRRGGHSNSARWTW